ncbi:MAG: hypothetical protein QF554_00545 [Dehalococcoidia bacterium]|nr:hypothetical protein [Dehalococcoidia bacterium]
MNLGSRRLLLPVLAGFAVVAAACSGSNGAELSPGSIIDPDAATAVAAGASKAPFVPIRADMDNEPAEFLDAIPEAENKCLEEIWGVDRYTAIRSGEERLDDESLDIFECMSGDTWSRIMAGGLFNEVGELSLATQACVAEKLAVGNVAAVANRINDLDGEPTLEDFASISIDMISEVIPVSFCLNEDERAVMDGQSQFGASIATLECLYHGAQSVGLDFSSVFQIAPAGYEPPAEYLQVAEDCGYPITVIPTPSGTDGRDRGDTSNTPASPSRDLGTPDPEPVLIPGP